MGLVGRHSHEAGWRSASRKWLNCSRNTTWNSEADYARGVELSATEVEHEARRTRTCDRPMDRILIRALWERGLSR